MFGTAAVALDKNKLFPRINFTEFGDVRESPDPPPKVGTARLESSDLSELPRPCSFSRTYQASTQGVLVLKHSTLKERIFTTVPYADEETINLNR